MFNLLKSILCNKIKKISNDNDHDIDDDDHRKSKVWLKQTAYSNDNGHCCLSQSPDKNSYNCILGGRIQR